MDVEHPVVPPASPTSRPDCVNRRPSRPISIRILMEDQFQDGFQVPLDDFLGDSVRDRGNSQRPGFRFAVALWDVDPPNRWRQVAPRGHSIPELVEVVREISLKVRDRLSVYSSRPLVDLHFLEGLPDFPLRNVERLRLAHRTPPVTSWLWVAAEQRSPFGPVPLQDLHPYCGPLRPCAPHWYSGPCGFGRLDFSLRIGTTGSHVPYKSLIRLQIGRAHV